MALVILVLLVATVAGGWGLGVFSINKDKAAEIGQRAGIGGGPSAPLDPAFKVKADAAEQENARLKAEVVERKRVAKIEAENAELRAKLSGQKSPAAPDSTASAPPAAPVPPQSTQPPAGNPREQMAARAYEKLGPAPEGSRLYEHQVNPAQPALKAAQKVAATPPAGYTGCEIHSQVDDPVTHELHTRWKNCVPAKGK
ncbi:MAG TPA: hypothetical protein VJG64_04125 [Candidatus Paceibacterota bacterium]